MKMLQSTRVWGTTLAVFMVIAITGQAIASQECWSLVSAKAEWKRRNANGHLEKISPDRLNSHISADKSWQWVEFDEPNYYGSRLTVNLSWSPPPSYYCVGNKMGIVFKLINKTRNDKNSNVVGSLSWGPTNTKGKGRKRVTIQGNESGKTEESTAIMNHGPAHANADGANVWRADVSSFLTSGVVNYYYAPARSQEATAQIQQPSATQQHNSTGGATTVANLSAHNEAFVRSLYHSILDRAPDEGGVRNWTQWLNQGKSRAWVITQFFNSAEYRSSKKNNTDYVRDLYQGVLGRQPDAGGLANWVNHLNSGKSRQFVLDGFLNSQEYRGNAKG